jgi:hypothetical protein
MPVATEFSGHLFHRATRPHLDGCPLGGSRREQAVLGGDAVVGEHPALGGTVLIDAAHAVFLPDEPHGRGVDGEVNVGDDRALFDLGWMAAAGTSDVAHHLLDAQSHVARGS